MSGTGIWLWFFLVAVLIIGCLFGYFILRDILTYRDLQRRLREEEGSCRLDNWGSRSRMY